MRVNVKKWGNSASVRIPAALMEAARLSLDDTVDEREKEYDLTQRLDGITPENLHTEVSFGPAVGKEAF